MSGRQLLTAHAERSAAGKPGEPLRFVASTDRLARDGLVIRADAWDLTNYRKNPVFLWVHDYWGDRMPIGRTVDVHADESNGKLRSDVVFDQADPFATQVERKYRDGYLNAVSVGWDSKEIQRSDNPEVAGVVTRAELLDISAVPVPGDADALLERQRSLLASLGVELASLDTSGVLGRMADLAINLGDDPTPPPTASGWRDLPPHATPKAPDGSTAVASDPDPAHGCLVDPDGTVRLTHHQPTGEVAWDAVAAAMVDLYARAAQTPEELREPAWRHLARHYRQFGRTPPEYRTTRQLAVLGDDEIAGLFLEGEDAHMDRARLARLADLLDDAARTAREVLSTTVEDPDLPEIDPDLLAGLRDAAAALTPAEA